MTMPPRVQPTEDRPPGRDPVSPPPGGGPSITGEILTWEIEERPNGYDVLVGYDETGRAVTGAPIGQTIFRDSGDDSKYSLTRAFEQAREQWTTILQLREESLTKDSPLGQYGPAHLLDDSQWEHYLKTTGEAPSDITGKYRSKYLSSPSEIEAAWNIFNPDVSLAEALGQKWEGGVIPSWFAQKHGISSPQEPRIGRPPFPQQVPWAGPPTPGFLTELTGLERGQPLEARPTKFASGQLLSRLTPSQLQGVGGYVNWAAGQVSGAPASFEDWFRGSQRLLPTSVPRGTVRWSPSQYRV
ncbi:hypothetical protein LCGC14_0396680 [marine sediment metagenome]|uniref:Uncharacterized protein n=1 Tax=marine sediment metagenome TaxID=412755 RepID=A0A0F9VK47_9ZZZZ